MDAQSYYLFSEGIWDEDGNLWLYPPVPYAYRELDDTIEHTVIDGDTPWSIAGRYWAALGSRASELYKLICDFQPTPIIDATVRLEAGTTIYVPSLRTVVEEIFNESRRLEVTG